MTSRNSWRRYQGTVRDKLTREVMNFDTIFMVHVVAYILVCYRDTKKHVLIKGCVWPMSFVHQF